MILRQNILQNGFLYIKNLVREKRRKRAKRTCKRRIGTRGRVGKPYCIVLIAFNLKCNIVKLFENCFIFFDLLFLSYFSKIAFCIFSYIYMLLDALFNNNLLFFYIVIVKVDIYTEATVPGVLYVSLNGALVAVPAPIAPLIDSIPKLYLFEGVGFPGTYKLKAEIIDLTVKYACHKFY